MDQTTVYKEAHQGRSLPLPSRCLTWLKQLLQLILVLTTAGVSVLGSSIIVG